MIDETKRKDKCKRLILCDEQSIPSSQETVIISDCDEIYSSNERFQSTASENETSSLVSDDMRHAQTISSQGTEYSNWSTEGFSIGRRQSTSSSSNDGSNFHGFIHDRDVMSSQELPDSQAVENDDGDDDEEYTNHDLEQHKLKLMRLGLIVGKRSLKMPPAGDSLIKRLLAPNNTKIDSKGLPKAATENIEENNPDAINLPSRGQKRKLVDPSWAGLDVAKGKMVKYSTIGPLCPTQNVELKLERTRSEGTNRMVEIALGPHAP